MCGCYVNGEKNILLKFRETFLNLEEDDYFKYLEIAKKVLSGTIENNILELNFELNEEHVNEKQLEFMKLKNSQLKDDFVPYYMMDELYDATSSEKEKLTIKNAGHAKASEIDPETYWTTVSNFINKYINQ
jgi:hypothetical protein